MIMLCKCNMLYDYEICDCEIYRLYIWLWNIPALILTEREGYLVPFWFGRWVKMWGIPVFLLCIDYSNWIFDVIPALLFLQFRHWVCLKPALVGIKKEFICWPELPGRVTERRLDARDSSFAWPRCTDWWCLYYCILRATTYTDIVNMISLWSAVVCARLKPMWYID